MSRNSFQLSIGQRTDGRLFLNLFIGGQRFRYSNGECIQENVYPNKCLTSDERWQKASLLKAKMHIALENGWSPVRTIVVARTFGEMLEEKAQERLGMAYSYQYLRDIRCLMHKWNRYPDRKGLGVLPLEEIERDDILRFIKWCTNSVQLEKSPKLKIQKVWHHRKQDFPIRYHGNLYINHLFHTRRSGFYFPSLAIYLSIKL